MGINDCWTAFDEMKRIQGLTKEENNSVRPERMMEFIDQHPVFDSCRILVMNPNGMDHEVFLQIFLRRLAQGNIVIAIMEVPEKDCDTARNSLNHASFVHSENGEVYFDGLRVNLDFLLRAFYFSNPTTLLVFALNDRGAEWKIVLHLCLGIIS